MKYALLLRPNSNIPFFEETKRLAKLELAIVFNKLKMDLGTIEERPIGKAFYLIVDLEGELPIEAHNHIKKLSFYYCAFTIEGESFIPLMIDEDSRFGDDLSVRLKYNGKTNEAFTRLLLNAGLYASAYYNVDNVQLFDPVCGKGTTLYEGLIRGCDVYGADINKTSTGELKNYFVRYLKEGRYKHQVIDGKAMHKSKKLGDLLTVKGAKSKEALKAGNTFSLQVFTGDTTKSDLVFKKKSIHLIAGDLPYGVAHMGKTEAEGKRNLRKLLQASFKSWYEVLKNGGALALSWNTYTNSREELSELLEEAGYKVVADDTYLSFEHRVSQAINRDIIVAVK